MPRPEEDEEYHRRLHHLVIPFSQAGTHSTHIYAPGTIHTHSPEGRTTPDRWAADSRTARHAPDCCRHNGHKPPAARPRGHDTGWSPCPPGTRIPIPPPSAADNPCAGGHQPESSSPCRILGAPCIRSTTG